MTHKRHETDAVGARSAASEEADDAQERSNRHEDEGQIIDDDRRRRHGVRVVTQQQAADVRQPISAEVQRSADHCQAQPNQLFTHRKMLINNWKYVCETWYLPHSQFHNERTVNITTAGCTKRPYFHFRYKILRHHRVHRPRFPLRRENFGYSRTFEAYVRLLNICIDYQDPLA